MKFIKVIAILCIIWCSELVCQDSEEYDEKREIIVYGEDEPHDGWHRERISFFSSVFVIFIILFQSVNLFLKVGIGIGMLSKP